MEASLTSELDLLRAADGHAEEGGGGGARPRGGGMRRSASAGRLGHPGRAGVTRLPDAHGALDRHVRGQSQAPRG